MFQESNNWAYHTVLRGFQEHIRCGVLMKRVMYDITYAARGRSGIPKDTRSVAEILLNMDDVELEFLISPKNFVSRYSIGSKLNAVKESKNIYSIFSSSPNVFWKTPVVSIVRSFIQSVSLQPFVKMEEISQRTLVSVLKQIGIKLPAKKRSLRIFMLRISYAARFARPRLLGQFRIRISDNHFYIQQQIDPIKVSRKSKHIVRLHDVLPIAHPYFFSENAQLAFRRGLASLLSNRKIIWVMDTEASKKEFLEMFGTEKYVEVIPCEVGYGLNPQTAIQSIKNKNKNKNKNTFLCVNTIEPRKNVGMIVNAFLYSLGQKTNDELIIVGSYGWMEEELISRLRSGFYGNQIKFIERAEEFQVEELFKKADFVISASEAEGFGLPPLEGMLFGCLPIVSDLPQHRETMGSKAIYFGLNEQSLSIAISTARKISISERQKLGLSAHHYVQNRFSHAVLKKKWMQLLQKLDS
jgi:glycosyltransferase involved in cell wall biosynthesis